MFIGPFTTYYLCFTTIFCFLTQLRNLINPITNQKTLRVYILRQYDPNSKKYIVTNLHAVLSSDCARSILQLYYKINTVKKKIHVVLKIFPQSGYQEIEKHMKVSGLLKALCI